MRWIVFLMLVSSVTAADYYFSSQDNGNPAGDDSNDGSIDRPYKSLEKVRQVILAHDSDDVVNLYFDRGDMWQAHTGNVGYIIEVPHDGPETHFLAYGSGPKPIFDGDVTDGDFSQVPVADGTDNYYWYHQFFAIRRPKCSFENLEMRNMYGSAIAIGRSGSLYPNHRPDGFVLRNCTMHDIGGGAVGTGSLTSVKDALVEHNTIYRCQQLPKYGKHFSWGGAIWLGSISAKGGKEIQSNNTARYNVVYDIYGEAITVCGDGLIEYNVVGDSYSVALNPAPHSTDMGDMIVRYNLVLGRQRGDEGGSSEYKPPVIIVGLGGSNTAIRAFDEHVNEGDNRNGGFEIYGNIVINSGYGIRVFHGGGPYEDKDVFGYVNVYNNLVIDNKVANYAINSGDQYAEGSFHDNAAIFYDRTGDHIVDYGGSLDTFDIYHNLYWTKGEDTVVDPDFSSPTDLIADPLLPGDGIFEWTMQDDPDYFAQLDIYEHIFPPEGSPLNDLGITSELMDKICEHLPLGCDSGDTCTSSWDCTSCTAWSECVDSKKTRTCTCTDNKGCSQDYDKTEESACSEANELVLYYTFDDIDSFTVLDMSGNGIDGEIHGSPESVGGMKGQAMQFDGDYLETGFTDDLNEWTVSVWAKSYDVPDSDPDSGPVMKQENFLISWDHTSDSFRGAAGLKVGSTWHAASFGPLEADTWHHLAATYDGETLRAYRDGELITDNTAPSGPPVHSGYSMKVARHAKNDYYFNGALDELKVYNYALSENEIEAEYSSVCVSLAELVQIIDNWLSSQIEIQEVLVSIGSWLACSE